MAEVADALGITVPTAKPGPTGPDCCSANVYRCSWPASAPPSTGWLKGNACSGRCTEDAVNTKSRRSPEALAAGAGMQPARAV